MTKFFHRKSDVSEIKERNKRITYFFLAPLILLASLEVMHLTFPNTIIRFFTSIYFPIKILLTYIFLLSVQGFFYALTQSSFVSNLLNTILMFTLGYATEVLGRIKGNPLMPTDILLLKNVDEIVSFAKIPFFISAVVAIIINIISLREHWKICRTQKKEISYKQRLIYSLSAVVGFSLVIYITCFSASFRYGFLPKIDVNISAFNPMDDYNSNGVVLTFFPRIGDIVVKEPENYSEAAINAIKDKYPEIAPVITAEKPNIIIIQNEAWWNPDLMPNVEYSVDLFSGINSIDKNIVKGKFLTPVFAGATCMPEFEVLTGMPTAFLPATVYPYTQYITDNTPSIVSAFKENGYQTIALHPYSKSFYNRSSAYSLLGFEKFKGDVDFDFKDMSGMYIDDMACVKQIIKEFENKTAGSIFEFVVTMENHGTYMTPRYDHFDFEMYAPTLPENEFLDLKRYSQGVYNADKAFKALVDYFESVQEPVIIAMYGDHLPLIGNNGSTYMNGGLVEQSDEFVSYNYPFLHETPYVVWTNYDCDRIELDEIVSGNNLGLSILKASGCSVPWYFNVINEFCNKYPAHIRSVTYNKNMEMIDGIAEEDMPLVDDYKMIMYDILNGEKYSINHGN